jgi:hypothetical protein
METEYVALEPSQKIHGKRNLLYCEMELLNTIKRYRFYKKLRKEELALKKLLKRAVTELEDELRKLDELLPKTKHHKLGPAEIHTENRGRSDLEQEIDDIKRKISELQ